MRVHWVWILVGVGVGYWVVPKVIPAVKSKA
jgi:hypothetical protein